MIRMLLVDDHPVVTEGLRNFLELDPEFVVVGEARNGARAVQMAHELRPDVVLMDLLMPVMDGFTATAAIRRELPDIEVVALTSVLEDGSVADAIRAGAIGYLLKDAEPDELRQAIRCAAAGQVQLAPRAAAALAQSLGVPQNGTLLTEREKDVLRLLAQGLSNKDLARALSVSETTAKTHVRSILSKLGVSSRTQAALYAVQTGLVPPPAANGSAR